MPNIFIISGPSGVGKDTLLKSIVPQLDNVFWSVSYTTRPIRNGEEDGLDYIFVTPEFFQTEVQNDNMLEYADYCNVAYGTPRRPIEKALAEGRDVILKIERAGMENVIKIYPQSVTIFIAPPSIEELQKRIIERKTDSDRAIQDRLKKAKIEIEKSGDYNYIFVNDVMDICAQKLIKFIKNYNK